MDDEERRQRRREYNRRYAERHPERRAASLKKYNNKPETKARVAAWIAKNSDQYVVAKNRWAKNHPEQTKANTERYRKEHPGWMAAQCAKRRARKFHATPDWLTEDDFWMIEEIYHLANLRSRTTGIDWSVDHIVPLQNKRVCGLHVPWNLQVITASENSIKGNRFVS